MTEDDLQTETIRVSATDTAKLLEAAGFHVTTVDSAPATDSAHGGESAATTRRDPNATGRSDRSGNGLEGVLTKTGGASATMAGEGSLSGGGQRKPIVDMVTELLARLAQTKDRSAAAEDTFQCLMRLLSELAGSVVSHTIGIPGVTSTSIDPATGDPVTHTLNATSRVQERVVPVSLADEFRQAQLDVCAELRRDTPYNPSRFEQGIRDGTGDQAVAFTRHLVVNDGEGATGFWRMRKLGRKHQTTRHRSSTRTGPSCSTRQRLRPRNGG